ncbi:MAG TPA: hypothetical protein DCG28_01270 [Lachnospiraceae bacterium]|nr:hypothetical protein [Lachnospiraceae bacterium]
MLTNESCTIFIRNGLGFDRFFVPKCHWQESISSAVSKDGFQSKDGITVYIFVKDITKMLRTELNTALSNRKEAAKDIIVKGECNFKFDGSSQQAASESMKKLNANYDVHTVMSIDRLLYGSENMQHYKITANSGVSR